MKILLLDIETAPHRVYAWGLYDQTIAINQVVEAGYTLCFSAKWYGSRDMIFDSVRKSGGNRMIRHAHKLLSEADAVVHYNGNKFDVPTLNQEFLEAGLKPPPPSHQVDLYRVAKSRFRFASNKLDFVAQSLNLGHKLHHKGMELWSGCMRGDAASWRTMERYNKQDVRLLERVYNALLPWIKNHPNVGNFLNESAVCTNCGSSYLQSNGLRRTAVSAYRRLQCQDCGAWMRGAVAEKRERADGSRIRPLRAA